MGPVFDTANQDLIEFYNHLIYNDTSFDNAVFALLKNIPRYSYFRFSQVITRIFEAWNGYTPSVDLVKNAGIAEADYTLPDDLFTNRMQNIENGYHNNFWDAVKIFVPMIEQGNPEAMEKSSSVFQDYNYGIYSDDDRINTLVTSIMSITLSMSAAIRGGLDETVAFSLSEVMIRKCLVSSSPAEIRHFGEQASYNYAVLVKESMDNAVSHSSIYGTIRYVREHIYSHISVQELADLCGYSLEHYSRLFKKECGFSANEFIYSCKLHESQHLLRSTGLSLSQIANMLAFSSQSHFQRRFKEKFHMTPLEYRNRQ